MRMLADCHVHSIFSHDGRSSMDELAGAAANAGLGCLCVTDHADDCVFSDFDAQMMEKLSAKVGEVRIPYASHPELYNSYLEAREKHSGEIKLLLGIEIGGMTHNPEKAAELASTWDFDYILSSLHNLRGMPDFYVLDYGNGGGFRELAEKYLDECIETVSAGGFDALAHMGYFLRYMAAKGVEPEGGFMDLRDRLEVLFTLMRDKGTALEVNTSGLFYNYPRLIPSRDVLKLYRECGGELITLGSDSHSAQNVGKGISQAAETLASLGFEYYTVYERRKPVMHRL